MSVQTVINQLLATGAVTALVPAAKITPMKRLQATDLPAITVELVTSDPNQSIAGDDTGLDQDRVRVNCWAATYASSKAIAAAVRASLVTLKSYYISGQDLYEDDTQIHRVALDFNIWTQ